MRWGLLVLGLGLSAAPALGDTLSWSYRTGVNPMNDAPHASLSVGDANKLLMVGCHALGMVFAFRPERFTAVFRPHEAPIRFDQLPPRTVKWEAGASGISEVHGDEAERLYELARTARRIVVQVRDRVFVYDVRPDAAVTEAFEKKCAEMRR